MDPIGFESLELGSLVQLISLFKELAVQIVMIEASAVLISLCEVQEERELWVVRQKIMEDFVILLFVTLGFLVIFWGQQKKRSEVITKTFSIVKAIVISEVLLALVALVIQESLNAFVVAQVILKVLEALVVQVIWELPGSLVSLFIQELPIALIAQIILELPKVLVTQVI